MHELIYSFGQPTDAVLPELSEVGGKALSLIRSSEVGLPVPPGIALGVSFFSDWIAEIKSTPEWSDVLSEPTLEGCDALKLRVGELRFDDGQSAALADAVEALAGDRFAVRSSSPEEDLEGMSFAGMYETFLGTTRENIEANVRRAWISMLDWRVVEYKMQQGMPIDNPAISVIVQCQIASEVSGVGFSLNPLNNCFDEAVINASFGLGEAIVRGTVTPDSYIVEKVRREILSKTVNEKSLMLRLADDGGIEEAVPTAPLAQALNDAQIMELTDLIGRCEAHYGHPVDVEWAYAADVLYLLQARPITTYVPLFPEMVTAPGERKQLYMDLIPLSQGFDDALSVLGADVWSIVLDRLKMGAMPSGPGGYIRNIHGRQYMQLHHMMKGLGKRVLPLLDDYDQALRGRAEEAFAEYRALEASPEVKQARRAQLGAVKKVLPSAIRTFMNTERSATEFAATTETTIATFNNLTNDRPFDELVDHCFDVFDGIIQQMALYVPGLLSSRKIERMFKGTEEESLTDAILMDLPSNPTSAMGHAMLALARFDDVRATADGTEFARRIEARDYSDEFLAAWDDYLWRYGARGFKEIDVASKRTHERLADFFQQIRAINIDDNQMLSVSARKSEALTMLRAAAARKGARRARALDKAVERINLTYGHRETPKYLVVVMNGNLRRIALEVADQFVAEGRLADREHIFDLHLEQVGGAQRDASLDLRALRAANLAPRELMRNVRQYPVFIDSRGKIFRRAISAQDGDFSGQPVSNGSVRGHAKVLASPYEKPLEPGEILVTVATEPAWTPVFVNASGVVLEIGGGLQHGAIIAREYGIPCVSGLPGVTGMINDGDLLEVDGTNGIVRVIEAA